MEKIILASHGALADGMAGAVQMIVGADPRLRVYSLDRYETPSRILQEVKKELTPGQAAVIVCDIKGGSVHNHLLELCVLPGVYLMTGMNLSMVLNLVAAPDKEELRKRCLDSMEVGLGDICIYDHEYIARKLTQKQEKEGEL
jgi:PTS system mannose-specific IIA component/fructoselysine and glucoselysine-specific PTS system IIA component